MKKKATYVESTSPPAKSVYRFGFWIALLTAVVSAAALAIGATTPPRSGPFCTLDMVDVCVTYPYTDVAAYVPRDYLWMYPAFIMGPLFALLVVCIHHYVGTEQKVFSQIALLFAAIAATTLATNYFVQLAVVQPSLLKGEFEGLSLLSQYNPHGLFIALEDVGNFMLGVSFLFVAFVFKQGERLARFLRFFFMVCGLLAVDSLIFLALRYGQDIEYRYEVISIMIDWLGLIVSGVVLSLFFRRKLQNLG